MAAGLIVSVLIFQQGWGLLMTALKQLTDAGVSPATKKALFDALHSLVTSTPPPSSSPDPVRSAAAAQTLLAISDLRAMRTGANMFVDLTAHVPAQLSVDEATAVERRIRETLVRARKDVKEVRVRFRAVSPGSAPGSEGSA